MYCPVVSQPDKYVRLAKPSPTVRSADRNDPDGCCIHCFPPLGRVALTMQGWTWLNCLSLATTSGFQGSCASGLCHINPGGAVMGSDRVPPDQEDQGPL
jgi:hypothetical protein